MKKPTLIAFAALLSLPAFADEYRKVTFLEELRCELKPKTAQDGNYYKSISVYVNNEAMGEMKFGSKSAFDVKERGMIAWQMGVTQDPKYVRNGIESNGHVVGHAFGVISVKTDAEGATLELVLPELTKNAKKRTGTFESFTPISVTGKSKPRQYTAECETVGYFR